MIGEVNYGRNGNFTFPVSAAGGLTLFLLLFEDLHGLFNRRLFMDDGPEGLHHGHRVVMLPDISAQV